MNLKPWVKSARLRTLPLALSGILLSWGMNLLSEQGSPQWDLFIFAVLTAVSLQVLSNFANDFGDYKKGTDVAAERSDRMLTAGLISETAMKRALVILSLLAFSFGMLLLWFSFNRHFHMRFTELFANSTFLTFLFLGLLSIGSAIFYTVGKRAYGYSGLGDLFVFVFFGLVPVLGMVILYGVQYIHVEHVLGACGMGFLSTAVLNVNNFRDMISDSASGKNTIAVKLGEKWTLFYHRLLLILGFFGISFSAILGINRIFNLGALIYSPEILWTLGVFAPFAILLSRHFSELRLLKPGDREGLNPQLKNLSLSILLAVLIYVGLAFWVFETF
jgi:1,4-dihydroxy-2-naphthoate octaprenyltransferase